LQVLFPITTRDFETISYRGALLSTLLHAIVYVFLHNLLNVLVQIAKKMGLHKKTYFGLVLDRDQVDASYEHDNKHSGSIKCWEVFE
jgi:hypothetical protein